MNFTTEHIRILEKNRMFYDQILANGTVSRLSSIIVDELQKVYSEAVRDYRFSRSCSACLVDLIESVYKNYKAYTDEQGRKQGVPGGKPVKQQQPGPAPTKSKGNALPVSGTGRTGKKDR